MKEKGQEENEGRGPYIQAGLQLAAIFEVPTAKVVIWPTHGYCVGLLLLPVIYLS